MTTEWEHIDWIRQQVGDSAAVPLGIGDDAALITFGAAGVIATVDMLLEGIHFDRSIATPRQIGNKGMNVNLSDMAAMAGQPVAALVAIGLPSDIGAGYAEEVFLGLKEAADAFHVALAGGDTNRAPDKLVLCVTLLGTPTGQGPVRRSGAQPGDALCVTGPLGYSLDGKHLSFTPRVHVAQWMHAHHGLHAMMDLSDGLGSDIFALCGASGAGAELWAEKIPIRPPTISDGRSPLDHALNDGEDFELLFTLAGEEAAGLVRQQPLAASGVIICQVGVVTREPGVRLVEAGAIRELRRGGFAHRW